MSETKSAADHARKTPRVPNEPASNSGMGKRVAPNVTVRIVPNPARRDATNVASRTIPRANPTTDSTHAAGYDCATASQKRNPRPLPKAELKRRKKEFRNSEVRREDRRRAREPVGRLSPSTIRARKAIWIKKDSATDGGDRGTIARFGGLGCRTIKKALCRTFNTEPDA